LVVKLYEYEAKELLARRGVKLLPSRLVTSPEEARRAAEEIGVPVVVKAQVLVAGRGKAGGIRLAKTPDEAEEVARSMLGSEIKGLRVRKLLVEKAGEIVREMYLSITLDRSARSYTILASPIGGVDIEEIAAKDPGKILRVRVDPFVGLRDYEVRRVVRWLGFEPGTSQWAQAESILRAMYSVLVELDAELVETNPLALLGDGSVVPLDARVIVDDNALYRHPELDASDPRDYSEAELRAKSLGVHYVELSGDIGIIANGAGLTMATMDLVKVFGGEPANFLDVGGGASSQVVREAVKMLLAHPRVRAILINIFGGITRVDEVARGIVEALREAPVKKPIVARLKGTNEEEGRRILAEAGIPLMDSAEDAAKAVVQLVKSS